jgi:hypothetical protein
MKRRDLEPRLGKVSHPTSPDRLVETWPETFRMTDSRGPKKQNTKVDALTRCGLTIGPILGT